MYIKFLFTLSTWCACWYCYITQRSVKPPALCVYRLMFSEHTLRIGASVGFSAVSTVCLSAGWLVCLASSSGDQLLLPPSQIPSHLHELCHFGLGCLHILPQTQSEFALPKLNFSSSVCELLCSYKLITSEFSSDVEMWYWLRLVCFTGQRPDRCSSSTILNTGGEACDIVGSNMSI